MAQLACEIDSDYKRFCLGSLDDPYPMLHRFRAEEPVHWSDPLQAWLLTRYDDVLAAHTDRRLVSGRIALNMAALPSEYRTKHEALGRHVANWLGFTDPPKHTRMRRLVLKAFTPRVVQSMRSLIARIVNELLDNFRDAQIVDMIDGFAFPLPAAVICEMLGVPPQARNRFRTCAEHMTGFVGGVGQMLIKAAELAHQSYQQIDEYFSEQIERRRTQPADDLFTALVNVQDEGDSLSDEELMGMAVFLFVAGHETTGSLLGNGILALAQDADLFQQLNADRSLIPSAVEEFLRHESPIQLNTRLAADDIELRGQRIRAGQGVVLSIGAANRDPMEFPDPDRLDITRQDNRHLAFGHGIHFCLGAPLARLEAEIALNAVFDRYAALQLATDSLNWRRDMTLRTLTSLPVRIEPSQR
jgi:cytochrome P450